MKGIKKMAYTEYQLKQLAEMKKNNELAKLKKLQDKYPVSPLYTDMSLHDELNTRYDIEEMKRLQQKYGMQQPQIADNQQSKASLSDKIWQKMQSVADMTESAALSFANGRTFGAFDELSGIGGGIVGTGKAVMNKQNPWNGFVAGYSSVRDDMRHKQKETTENYPWLGKPMELLGGGYAGNSVHIINNAILSGIGYAETPDDIKDKTFKNLIGNVIASYIPTQIFPKPINYIANEYISRYSPIWLKDFNNE